MSNVIGWMVGQLTKMVMLLALVGSVAHADSYYYSAQAAFDSQQRQLQIDMQQQVAQHNQMVRQIQQMVQQQIADTQRSIQASMMNMPEPDEEVHVVRQSHYSSSSSRSSTRSYSAQSVQPAQSNTLALDDNEQVFVPAKPAAKTAPPPVDTTSDNVRLTQEQQQLSRMGIPIISGVRSQQEQEALKDHQDANGQWYTAQGRPVANHSAHRTGDAIDTGPLNAEQRKKLASAGWFQPIPQQDPGHWEKINPSTSVASR